MVNDKQKILDQKSLLIIFTYAPAGFGHLRVTDALYHGLINKDNSVILDVPEKVITYMHRVFSIHPVMTKIFEWMQKGMPEEIFTRLYRVVLHSRTKHLYNQITDLVKQRGNRIKTILVISTHFALAHQIGRIKPSLEKELGLKLILAVQITDDSPQKLWYVRRADVIFTPSKNTAQTLHEYGIKNHYREPQFKIIPYPISPPLTELLSDERYKNRLDQLNPQYQTQIEVMIPVSGAAVGLKFILNLTRLLAKVDTRFKFTVLVKKTFYTEMFVRIMTELPYVNVHIFPEDRQMVDNYEEIYQQQTISIEITKPSEQAFKALLSPQQVGGSILLFTKPVGRQEYDNLEYLRQNKLIPSVEETKNLWQGAKEVRRIDVKVKGWRGIQLPDDPPSASVLINWLMNRNILLEMVKLTTQDISASKGVERFWQNVADYLVENSG